MFETLKKKKQDKVLRLLSGVTREKRIENISKVRDIAVIFTVGDEDRWNTLLAFVRQMEQQNKHVWLIGFQRDTLEINYIFSHQQTTICHEKEDFNFFGLPKEGVVEGFTGRHYDLLIDASSEPTFFANYTAARALADLKVAYVDPSQPTDPNVQHIFDLLIRKEQPIDIPDYLEEVTKYLSMIQK